MEHLSQHKTYWPCRDRSHSTSDCAPRNTCNNTKHVDDVETKVTLQPLYIRLCAMKHLSQHKLTRFKQKSFSEWSKCMVTLQFWFSKPKPCSYQVILSELLPLAQAILGLRRAKLWWGRKNPIKKLTFWQLTLQCCHHYLTLSDIISLSSSSFYSESSTHPSSESSTLCSLS